MATTTTNRRPNKAELATVRARRVGFLDEIINDDATKLRQMKAKKDAAEKRFKKFEEDYKAKKDAAEGKFKKLDNDYNTFVESHKDFTKDMLYLKEQITRSHGGPYGSGESNDFANKVAYVMREFKNGNLYTNQGRQVTDPRQALAIALSEGRRLRRIYR
jgi:hypothetical protein